MCWRWKSRSSEIRNPKLDKEIRDLIPEFRTRIPSGAPLAFSPNFDFWEMRRQSAGKNFGFSGQKIGNVHLKRGLLASRRLVHNPEGQKLLARLEKKHGKQKALTILAHKLARAVYFILRREKAFDLISDRLTEGGR
jgi:hypothetical protein